MEYKGYKIDVVCANNEDGIYGDIYGSVEDCQAEHPGEKILFGYYADPADQKYEYDTETPDWFDSLAEAMAWIDENPLDISKGNPHQLNDADYVDL